MWIIGQSFDAGMLGKSFIVCFVFFSCSMLKNTNYGCSFVLSNNYFRLEHRKCWHLHSFGYALLLAANPLLAGPGWVCLACSSIRLFMNIACSKWHARELQLLLRLYVNYRPNKLIENSHRPCIGTWFLQWGERAVKGNGLFSGRDSLNRTTRNTATLSQEGSRTCRKNGYIQFKSS